MNAPSGRGRAARIWRVTAAVLGGVLISAALLIGALRLAIARVPENAARIQAWVEQQTGLRVEYDELSARLRWFGPEVVLRGVRILQRDGTQALFRSREGSVGLDLWSLFRSGELVAGRVRFVGPAVTVVRLKDGRIRLLGQNDRPLDRPPFDLDRLPAGRVEISDATVTYRDYVTGAMPVTLSGMQLSLRRQHSSTAVSGSASLPASLGRRVSFSGDLHGSLEHFDALDARLELRVDRLALQGLAPFVPAHVARPIGGSGQVDAVVRFAGGTIRHARLGLDLQDVRLALPKRDVPAVETLRLSAPQRPAGAPPMSLPVVTSTIEPRPADVGPAVVDYPRLQGTVRLGHDGGAWFLGAQKLLLGRASDRRVRGSEVALRWTGNALTTYSVALSAEQLRIEDAWPLVLAFAPPGFDRWAGLAPKGEINSLRADVSRERAGAWPTFTIAADVSELGFAACGGRPGMTGLTGVVSGTDQRGRLVLRSKSLSFDLPRMFREPIADVAVAMDADWRRDGDAWIVGSNTLTVNQPHVHAHGSFAFRYDRPGVSPDLMMDLQVDGADVEYTAHVLPYGSFGPGAVSWLAPAFLGGRVEAGHVTYRGPIHKFPFRDGEGDFTATASVRDVAVDYFAGFAPLERGHGVVEFHNAGFVARMHGGDVGGLRLDHAEVGIADMDHTVVEVDAAASGDLAKALPFVQRSPVGAVLGPQFTGLTGSGPADFAVTLHLPGDEAEEHHFRIATDLHSATIGLPALRAPLQNVNGQFEIRDLAMSSRALTGTLLNGPFELAVEPGPPTRDTDASVVFHGRGHAVGSGLPQFIGLPAAIRMSGSLDWRFEGRIERHRDSGQWWSHYEVGSDLSGLSVAAPEPFSKSASEPRPARVGLTFAPDGHDEIAVDYGPARVRLLTAEGDDGRVHLDRGIARYDGKPLVLPDGPGLRFAGDWPAFDLGDWLSLASGGPGPSLSEWLGPTEVHLDKARIFGFEFTELDATLNPRRAALQVHVSGPGADGDVTIPTDLEGGGPIRFAMSRMLLQPSAASHVPKGAAPDPRHVPALEVDVGDFEWQARRFGHVVANVAKDPLGLRLTALSATSPDFTITAHGDWLAEGSGSRTSLAVELVSNDLAATSRELGIPGEIEAKKAKAVAAISWPGGPTDEIVAHMSGTLSLSLQHGQLRSLKPGAGRVLGLTSLAELPRRLSLDFRDVTDTGLAFDTVRGDFEIRDGNAYTQNVLLKGASIDLGLVGRTGLAAQDYDQVVVVSGNPVGAATVAGALAAGPIGAAGGFIFSQLFKGQLQGLARVYYRITGPWSNPVIERVSAAAATETPAPAPQQDLKK